MVAHSLSAYEAKLQQLRRHRRMALPGRLLLKANNTGVLVHMQLPDNVWPPCIQNQGKSGRQGDLFVMSGVECKVHLALGKDANTPVPLRGASNEHPVGQWDTNVTVCAGNDVQAIINGEIAERNHRITVTAGFVGIQSEGADFEIRKMYLEPIEQPTEFFKVITDAQTGEYAVVNSDKTTADVEGYKQQCALVS